MGKEEQKAYHCYIRGIILIGLAMLLFKLLVTGIFIIYRSKMIKFTYIAFVVILILVLYKLERWKRKQHDCNCCKHHTTSKIRDKKFLCICFICRSDS